MKCEKYLNMIDDLVEGELDEHTKQQVNSHIFACQVCQHHYELLKQEREMYEQYFEIEPSTELWMELQTKLKIAKANNSVETAKASKSIFDWKSNIFEYLQLSPALTCAALILIFGIGFGLLNFSTNKKSGNDYVAKIELKSNESPSSINRVETVKDVVLNPPEKTESNNNASFKVNKNSNEKRKWNNNVVFDTKVKMLVVKETKPDKNVPSREEKEVSFNIAQLDEERMQQLQVKNLESEAAKQIEKVELLLRSFRNSRFNDKGETFDIAYEKQEAERLLKRNEQLMRSAEIYGTFHTKEILSKAEPFLLDISNLEKNSSPVKIQDIKERVRSQKIIASLQAY